MIIAQSVEIYQHFNWKKRKKIKISGHNNRKVFNRLISSSTRCGHEMTCSKVRGQKLRWKKLKVTVKVCSLPPGRGAQFLSEGLGGATLCCGGCVVPGLLLQEPSWGRTAAGRRACARWRVAGSRPAASARLSWRCCANRPGRSEDGRCRSDPASPAWCSAWSASGTPVDRQKHIFGRTLALIRVYTQQPDWLIKRPELLHLIMQT